MTSIPQLAADPAPSQRRRVLFGWAAVAALAAAGGFVGLQLLLPTSYPPSGERPAGTLRVAAANLFYANERVEQVTAVLGRLDADVLVVLEWTGSNLRLEDLAAGGWRVVLDGPSRGPHGALVLVRSTLEAVATLEPPPSEGPCPLPVAALRVRAGETWVSVLGVHAPPPIEECEESNLAALRGLARLVRDGRLGTSLGAAQEHDPVIVAGDLNASPASPGLAWLREAGLVDAYARRRWLPRGTWAPERGPHLSRLDYVLASRLVRVDGAWIVDLPGSDHRAVITDLDLRGS